MSRAPVLAGCLALTSCSSATTRPPARAALLVQVGPGGDPGQNDAIVCGIPTQTFAVPDLVEASGVGPSNAVQDGSWSDAGMAVVQCSVRASGDAYAVETALATGDGDRAMISGTMSRSSSDARASFTRGAVTFASQGACSVDFSADVGMDVQPGRVWAVVTCPRAIDDRGNTCLASAAFLFEDCTD